MKKILLTLILSLLAATVFAKKTAIPWNSYSEGMKKAVKEKKYLIVDFYTDWCKWCKVMEEKTYANPKVLEVVNQYFILAKVDADKVEDTLEYQGKAYSLGQFLTALNVTGFPSTAFFDPKGEIITLVPGMIPAETFVSILHYIRQDCHEQKISFKEYQQKKAAQCK